MVGYKMMKTYLILDELLPTVNNVVEPIWISGSDIPCLEPLVLCDRVLGRSHVVQVSLPVNYELTAPH